MSYTKTNWQSGDVISAEKLNKMEDGIAEAGGSSSSSSSVFIINNISDQQSPGTYRFYSDKTVREIINAMNEDKIVVIKSYDETLPFVNYVFITDAGKNPDPSEDNYFIRSSAGNAPTLYADSLDGHPYVTGLN